MKKTLILAASLVGAVSGYSQGTVNFLDAQTDMTVHIFAPQTATPGTELTGNQGTATSGASTGGVTTDIYDNNGTDAAIGNSGLNYGGSAVYTGGAIGNTAAGNATLAGAYNYNNGSDYSVELYAAPGLNAPASALQPVTQYLSTLRTSGTVGGEFKNVTLATDPGITGTSGGSATIALVAWYNGGGTYSSYSAALTAGVPTGVSALDNIAALGGTGSPAAPTPDLLGLQSFSLVVPVPVPEPSTVALGVIGASTLLFRRRKK
jgi:hypothetical protein